MSINFIFGHDRVRRSNTHWTIIFELEEIESNQVERIYYLGLVGSVHGETVK